MQMQREVGGYIITFGSLKEFAEKAHITYEELCRELLKAAVHEIGRRWVPLARSLTPVRSGLMKKSWRYFQNEKGETTKGGGGGEGRGEDGYESVKNYAPHAAIIDRGRKRGGKGKGHPWRNSGKARMLGSRQAPRGVTMPVWRRILGQRQEITQDAIQRALDKFSKRVKPTTTLPTPR